jgi:hypothetical protein
VSKYGRPINPKPRYLYTNTEVNAYKASLTKLLQDESRSPGIVKSIQDEVANLMADGIMEPMLITAIPKIHRPNVIRLWLFHKEKLDANGKFLKDKSRIVTLSQSRDLSNIGLTYSPTVNPISFFVMMAIVATLPDHALSAYDIKGAFLNSKIPEETHVYVRADKDLAEWFIMTHPHLKKIQNQDMSLTFRLRRYLYGLQESPIEWNKTLHGKLTSIGFQRAEADQCLYTKSTREGAAYLTVHVDDMMLASPSVRFRSWFEESIKKWYEIVIQHTDITYLGMSVTKSAAGIKVHQAGYIDAMIAKYQVDATKTVLSPTGASFLEDTEKKVQVTQTKYLGLVMSLMYLARFTRPDILMPITYLATKSAAPTEDDYAKAIRVLAYAATTRSRNLIFRAGADLTLQIFADAAHMLHKDGKGHGGIIGTMGSAPIFSKSYKFKLVTRSSTESEMVCLDEAVTYAIWLTSLLRDFKFSIKLPVKMLQDNLSTIGIVLNGGTFARTKHMITKYGYIKQHVDLGNISLEHCRTQVMAADMVTKPLAGTDLKKLSQLICIVDE